MAKCYVRIPLGDRPKYPRVCAFTGNPNPRRLVRISRSQNQMILPIPFVGIFRMKRVGRISFPASTFTAGAAVTFSRLALVSFYAGIVAMIIYKKEDYAVWFIGGGIGLMIFFKMLHTFVLRKVRVVRLGMNSVEVCFTNEEYAEEFCRLNEYRCQTQPGKKRSLPISVNPVG